MTQKQQLWFWRAMYVIVLLITDIPFFPQPIPLLIQTGTFLSCLFAFCALFSEPYVRYYGVLLYMTCPYRLYLLSEGGDLPQAALWLLLPLLLWAFHRIPDAERKLPAVLTASVVLALAGYTDAVTATVLLGLCLACALLLRSLSALCAAVCGFVLALPGLFPFLRYLLRGSQSDLWPALQSIMAKGYHPGQFFAIHTYAPDHPGLGFGLLLSLALLLWLTLIQKQIVLPRLCRLCALLSGGLLLLSCYFFPWDVAQRLGAWSLRLISSLQSPALFWGLACACLCVPGAFALGSFCRQREKEAAATALFLAVTTACLVLSLSPFFA